MTASAPPWPVLLMSRELGIGGTERQLCEIAKALDRSRFIPHVGCFHSEGFRAKELSEAGVPVVEFPVRSFASLSAIRGLLQFGSYVRANDVRIVHAFDVPMDLFAAPAARIYGVPLVLSSQRAHRALTPGLTRHLLRMTDMIVDALVVNSKAVRDELVAGDRVEPRMIRLCYNGIDTERFNPAGRRRQPGLEDACLVIGAICAFRPEKSLTTLLDAFALVRGSQPRIKLLLVGSGPEEAQLKEHSRKLGIEDACVFEPAATDVPSWLRSIDIFVLPSLSEALSNSLMEAMACGCCVVASDAGGNPELVQHERTGLLFRAGDARDLASQLKLLIEHDFLRERLAEAGARFILENFSLQAAAECMADIYSALIREKGLNVSWG